MQVLKRLEEKGGGGEGKGKEADLLFLDQCKCLQTHFLLKPRARHLLDPLVKAAKDWLVAELNEKYVDERHGAEEQPLDHDGQPKEDGHRHEPDEAAEHGVVRKRAPAVTGARTASPVGRQAGVVNGARRVHVARELEEKRSG